MARIGHHCVGGARSALLLPALLWMTGCGAAHDLAMAAEGPPSSGDVNPIPNPTPTPTPTPTPYPLTPGVTLTVLPRSTVDRPDERSGYQVHVIYVVPSDGVDRQRDVDGEIVRSVYAFDRWFARQTDGLHLRVDTSQAGAVDVSFLRIPETDATMVAAGLAEHGRIERAIQAAGFNDPQKIYAVYYEGGNRETCGDGAWPPRAPGKAGILYLQGAPGCIQDPLGSNLRQPQYLDFGMLHEIVHVLGFVAACGVHNIVVNGFVTAHITNPLDLMYGGGGLTWHPSQLDAEHTDYFRVSGSHCLDLSNSAFLEPLPATAEPRP